MESELLPESFNEKVKNFSFPIIISFNPFLYIINSLKHTGVPIYLNHQELVLCRQLEPVGGSWVQMVLGNFQCRNVYHF